MPTIELGSKVTDEAGVDQEGLTVSLFTAANYESGSAATASTTTDSDGLWAFSSVADGTYIVEVQNEDGSLRILFDGRSEVQFTNVDIRSELHVNHPIPRAVFSAYNSVTDSNVTGAGGAATVDFDTEIFDEGGDFASDTFTAPVTGRYLLSVCVYVSGITGAGDSLQLSPITSNRTYEHLITTVNNLPAIKSMVWSMVVDMDVNDTVTFTIVVTGESGDDIVDIVGGAAPQTVVSGVLVG